LAYPGAPVFHSIVTSLMDPRTGAYIAEVPVPLSWMAVQLGHAWNVPSLGGGSVSSDAPDIGWQSGGEAGLGSAFIPLCGGEICGYMGLVGGSMILYPEQVILDHEICQVAYDLLHGFEFDEGDMALDVIGTVGPRGHFLAQKHTRTHIRDFRLSPLLRQKNPDGSPRDPRQVALRSSIGSKRLTVPSLYPKQCWPNWTTSWQPPSARPSGLADGGDFASARDKLIVIQA
jgi:trimethylamine:corrinoid methyltransferase-like protein